MGDVFIPGVVDLYGDPVPASRGKKGRPPHVPTAENRKFVELALACGKDEEAIAAGLRITPATLRRHYFHELEGKRAARLRLDMKNLAAIVAAVEAGKPAAMALLDKRMKREGLAEGAREMATPSKPKKAKPGKKEQLVVDAAAASTSGEWGSLLKH